jgi:cytochrome c-type biogenesis protein CcsB
MKSSKFINNSKLKGVKLIRNVLKAFPKSDKLERQSYQFNIIGFILWTFTLIAGAIWADKAWHRFWGWDTKEVWTFIIWTIYAAYLHATTTRGWDGKRAAWLTLIGFTAILFNFTIVNLYFKGLHAYSGL